MAPDSKVAKGAHATLLLDRAGWHTTSKLDLPDNITPIFLPCARAEPGRGADRPGGAARDLADHEESPEVGDAMAAPPKLASATSTLPTV